MGASAQSFGAVKSKSKTVTVDSSTNPSRKAPNAKMEELKARAAQGCPHARKQLEEIEKTAEHINTGQDAVKIPSAEEIETLKARAEQGCPHARQQLENLEKYAESLVEEGSEKEEGKNEATEDEKGCRCDKADRKNSESAEKDEDKDQKL